MMKQRENGLREEDKGEGAGHLRTYNHSRNATSHPRARKLQPRPQMRCYPRRCDLSILPGIALLLSPAICHDVLYLPLVEIIVCLDYDFSRWRLRCASMDSWFQLGSTGKCSRLGTPYTRQGSRVGALGGTPRTCG